MSDAKRSPAMTRTADLLIRRPPARKPARGVDHNYWFFGTLALYCHGPPHFDRWRKHDSKAIIATQCNSGSTAGSWDPNGTWGAIGGRVYSTAMMTMTLTMHYRYSRLVR